MTTISIILGALTALPDLIKFLGQVMTWLNAISGNDPKGYVVKLGAAMKELNEAESDEDRQKAARAISDAIAGL